MTQVEQFIASSASSKTMIGTDSLKYISAVQSAVSGPIGTAFTSDASLQNVQPAPAGILARVLAEEESRASLHKDLMEVGARLLSVIDQATTHDPNAEHLLSRLKHLQTHPDTDLGMLKSLITEAFIWLSGSADGHAHQLCTEMLELEARHNVGLEQRYEQLRVSRTPKGNQEPKASGFNETQSERLVGLLRREFGESENLEIESFSNAVGGLGKQTTLVKLRNNKSLPDEIVLRADHPQAPQESTVVAEFPLLQLLYSCGVMVPKPIYLDERGEISEHPLIIVSRLPGQAIADGLNFFAVPRSEMIDQLARVMAAVHAIPVPRLRGIVTSPGGDNHVRMREHLVTLRRVWDEFGEPSIVVEAALRWLVDNLENVGDQECLVHGDFRFNNILVDQENIRAILDWETATIGNPGFDIGYAYHHVVQVSSWTHFTGAYVAAGGVLPNELTLKFYVLRADVFAVVYLAKLKAAFVRGHIENLDLIYASCNLRQHALYLLSMRLNNLLANKPL